MTLVIELPPGLESAPKEQARTAAVLAEEFALQTLSRSLTSDKNGAIAPDAPRLYSRSFFSPMRARID